MKNHKFGSLIASKHVHCAFVIEDEGLVKALGDACMKFQMVAGELIAKYVKEGLKREGFLKT